MQKLERNYLLPNNRKLEMQKPRWKINRQGKTESP